MNTFNVTIIQHYIDYFSVYTQNDLGRIEKETIKKTISLIDG